MQKTLNNRSSTASASIRPSNRSRAWPARRSRSAANSGWPSTCPTASSSPKAASKACRSCSWLLIASSGAWVSQDGSQGFQPNPAPPFFDQSGRCYTLDVLYHSYNGRAYYALNAYNADAAGADMRVGGGTSYDLTQMGTYLADLPATADENSGIFLSSGPDTSDAYFGLYNGRLYRVSLN